MWSSYVADDDLANSPASTSPTAGLRVITTKTEFFESLKIIYLCARTSLSPVTPHSVCAWVCVQVHEHSHMWHCLWHVWRLEDKLPESVLSFHLVELRSSGMIARSFTGWANSLPVYFVLCFETDLMSPGWHWTCYVIEHGFELLTFLPLSPKCWEYGLVRPCLSSSDLFEFKLDLSLALEEYYRTCLFNLMTIFAAVAAISI